MPHPCHIHIMPENVLGLVPGLVQGPVMFLVIFGPDDWLRSWSWSILVPTTGPGPCPVLNLVPVPDPWLGYLNCDEELPSKKHYWISFPVQFCSIPRTPICTVIWSLLRMATITKYGKDTDFFQSIKWLSCLKYCILVYIKCAQDDLPYCQN